MRLDFDPRALLGRQIIPSAALMLFLVGCGSITSVSGKVTHKGKEVTVGNVIFVGGDGKKAVTSIGPDGMYKLVEPPLGKVKVAVDGRPIKLNLASEKDKEKKAPPKGAKQAKSDSLTPDIYIDPNRSGLTTEIKSGANTYDIELK